MDYLLIGVDGDNSLHYSSTLGQYDDQVYGYPDAPSITFPIPPIPHDVQSIFPAMASPTTAAAAAAVLASSPIPPTILPATSKVIDASNAISYLLEGRSPKVARIETTRFNPSIAPRNAVTRTGR